MPPALTYPGVYVQEIPSGVRTIVGVGTSIGMFIGRARRGPLKQPTQCLSVEDFERAFSSQYAKSDLARSVRLFFTNGGTQCYVTRIAGAGSAPANITLNNEAGTPTLVVTAKAEGTDSNSIRVRVDYNTVNPESTFNMEVFRWEKTSLGDLQKRDSELYLALDMDPNSARYAVNVVNQSPSLVALSEPAVVVPPNAFGLSMAGRQISSGTLPGGNHTTFRDQCALLFGAGVSVVGNRFRISVNGNPFVTVDLSTLNIAGLAANAGVYASLGALIEGAIKAADPTVTVAVTFPIAPTAVAGSAYGQPAANNEVVRNMLITSAGGDVRVEAVTSSDDLARPMMMGTAFGGIEISKNANRRPAPSGVVADLSATLSTDVDNYLKFGSLAQSAVTSMTIVTPGSGTKTINFTGANTLQTNAAIAGAKIWQDKNTAAAPIGTPDPGADGIREKLGIIAAAVVGERANDPKFPWTAEVWGSRLALLPAEGVDNLTATVTFNVAGAMPVLQNVRYYSLGTTGTGTFQGSGGAGADGGKPAPSDYDAAYQIIDKEVDLYNLMVLPKDHEHSDTETTNLWGPASVFCKQRRAFLLMDPPPWKDSQAATSPSTGVNTLRIGLVKDYSALYYPRLVINENGAKVSVGPSGAIAGLMARIDSTRGVWKAPAGTEADLRGVVGVEQRFSDGENGVMNPKAINTIRVFPEGIVNWGARTMDGDDAFASEYKYVPIRRLALFIEESLYRGLKWVVFEPNDEPLWAQIRLNVGAFMHNLFRQGAFQGATPRDAYFVKCDKDTTTQNDRNLGIVNIIVGFAPLKPAEFVMLYLQQMAGQIEV